LEPGCDQYKDPDFVIALAAVIRSNGISCLPLSVAQLYLPFFAHYVPEECHKSKDHLSYLFKLAEKIKADLKWLSLAIDAWYAVIDYNNLGVYLPNSEIVKEFMCHIQLYSWPYIEFMRTQLSEIGLLYLPRL
jgi:hypothetical protein